ncbi:MAG: 2'-5' RNA ligase family protein [Acetobacteraceae bacterium]|nr:2'-5' RNA ligase family protein [Acetobacteraceae bacterium]
MESLVVTGMFEQSLQDRLDGLRNRHFPPGLNRVPAHISLFHYLPGSVLADLADAVTSALPCLPAEATFTGIKLLGRGVALAVTGPGLEALHHELSARYSGYLTRQDRQPFRPHVTIQNKVDPPVARTLAGRLRENFVPEHFTVMTVAVWFYRAGRWESAASIPWNSGSAP